MKKAIAIVLLVIVFTGCMTVERIERNCDKFEKICKTSETIIYKDSIVTIRDTVRISLPRDTVTIRDTVRIKENKCFVPYKYTKKGLITVWSGVENSIMTVEAWLNDSSAIRPIKDTVLIKTPETTKYITKTKEVKPKWYRPLWIYFIITIVLGLVWVIKQLLKIKSIVKF